MSSCRSSSARKRLTRSHESTRVVAAQAPATYIANRPVSCVVIDRTLLREVVEFTDDEGADGPTLELADLEVIAVLGMGGFGRVKLVTHPATDSYYALKCMYKGLVIAKRQASY